MVKNNAAIQPSVLELSYKVGKIGKSFNGTVFFAVLRLGCERVFSCIFLGEMGHTAEPPVTLGKIWRGL
jgi:hypothetical protein